MTRTLARPAGENHFPTLYLFGYHCWMEVTGTAIRRLQRSLNALGRGACLPFVKVDGKLGRRTIAALTRFLAARGREGEEALVRALRALR